MHWADRAVATTWGVVLTLALSACGGSGIDPRTIPTAAVSGLWASTTEVGSLGTLHLALAQREDSRVYDGELSSPNLTNGLSDGVGTLAGGHLILDFDAGLYSEYFLEATLEQTGSVTTAISGQLVFPDQQETLPVRFVYSGPLPPAP